MCCTDGFCSTVQLFNRSTDRIRSKIKGKNKNKYYLSAENER